MLHPGLPHFAAGFTCAVLFLGPVPSTAQVRCTASVPSVLTISPSARGTAELVGDYVLTCEGGTAGSQVAGNLVAQLNMTMASSSRPQLLIDGGSAGSYPGAVTANMVSFEGVSYWTPATASPRTLRITGIQAAVSIIGMAVGEQVLLFVSFSNPALIIANPMQTVAVVRTGPAAVSVTLTPPSVTLQEGATQQFTATVTGTGDSTVRWSVDGFAGGNARSGTITATGFYTAPVAAPDPPTVTVTATSTADPTKSAAATVAITRAITTGPAITEVTNGASFQAAQGIAPHSYVTIKGRQLAPESGAAGRVWRVSEIVEGRLPTVLDGVMVTIGGKAAAIEFVSQTQVNVIAAADTPLGDTVPVVLTNSAGTSNTTVVRARTYSPAFFLWPNQQVVASRLDGALVARNGSLPGTTTAAARPADLVTLWGNGFGPTTPAIANGVVTGASPIRNLTTVPAISIGGVPAEYVAGAMTPGLAAVYQVTVRIPSVATGDQPVTIWQGGVQGPDGMVLAVQGLSPSNTLEVTKSGSGTVTSTPAGINCGSTCRAAFPSGSSVTLAAAPAAGFAFSGWSVCTGTGPCTVTIDGDRTVAARFAPLVAQNTLTVNKTGNGAAAGFVVSSPAGVSCGGICSYGFPAGTVVTLMVDNSTGFAGWSGACTGFNTTCAVTMDSAKAVTATFLSGPLKILEVFQDGQRTGASGLVESSPVGIKCEPGKGVCGTRFPAGEQVVLRATAAAGSRFTGWGSSQCGTKISACDGATDTCMTILDMDKCVTANFTQPTSGGEGGPVMVVGEGVRVRVDGIQGSGRITSNPPGINCTTSASSVCGAAFAFGLPVVLTAMAEQHGYAFTGWDFNYYNPSTARAPKPECPGTGPCTVPAYIIGGEVRAVFRPSSTPPPSTPIYCNVSCSGSCFSPPVSFQDRSCAACSWVYNWCQWILSFGCSNYKTVLYWNACQ